MGTKTTTGATHMKDHDQIRLEKDLISSLAKVARRLIKNKKDPYTLTEKEVEPNGTKRPKTIRLLSNRGGIRRVFLSGNMGLSFYNVFKDEAHRHTVEPMFNQIKHNVTLKIKNNYTFREDLDTIAYEGYRDIEHLSPKEVLYVYFNLGQYDIITQKELYSSSIITKVFPKNDKTKRKIELLKGLLKQHCEPILRKWLEIKTGLTLHGFDVYTNINPEAEPVGKYLRDNKEPFEIPNFMHTPVDFNEEKYQEFYKSYCKTVDLLTGVDQNMSKFVEFIQSYGYEKLMTEFLEYAKKELMNVALESVASEDKKGTCVLVLNDSALVTFENMFGENNDR